MTNLIEYESASDEVRAVYIASHTAAACAKGLTEKVRGELLAIVATTNSTNRLANGYQIPVDEQFR